MFVFQREPPPSSAGASLFLRVSAPGILPVCTGSVAASRVLHCDKPPWARSNVSWMHAFLSFSRFLPSGFAKILGESLRADPYAFLGELGDNLRYIEAALLHPLQGSTSAKNVCLALSSLKILFISYRINFQDKLITILIVSYMNGDCLRSSNSPINSVIES